MPSLLHPVFRRPLLAALLTLCAANQSFAKTEYDIKAAYLYNFIKFVSWPGEIKSLPLRVCLYGQDPINEKLMPLKDIRIHDREVEVKLVEDIADAPSCAVLYIAREQKKQLAEIVTVIDRSPVLMISDIPDFAKSGGTIGFVTLGNVIRFDVNLIKARASGISISSKLLELANQVVR